MRTIWGGVGKTVWHRLRSWPAAFGASCGSWLEKLGTRRRSQSGLLSVVARLDLGAKKALLVVAFGERRYLVASSAESIPAMIEVGGVVSRTAGGRSGRNVELRFAARRRRRRLKPGGGGSRTPDYQNLDNRFIDPQARDGQSVLPIEFGRGR